MTAIATNGDDDQVLFRHIAEEFGDHGARAVEFIATAAALLHEDTLAPRVAETVCYCLREALKEIPQAAETPSRKPWRAASRAVVDARSRYVIATSLPGSDPEAALKELLQAVDDMELVHKQERIHQQRLLAVMAARTGTLPIPSGPIETYQTLVERLDGMLHSRATVEQAKSTYREAVGILRQLFMPPELRLPELAALAELPSPTRDDVARLDTLVASPRHLEYFFGKVVSADWLMLLDESEHLTPPEGQGHWPVFKLVDRLKNRDPAALATWLMNAYMRWGSSATAPWFIARAALDIGVDGRPIVLAALKGHSHTPLISHLGLSLIEQFDPHDHVVVEVADHAFNPSSGFDKSYLLDVVGRRLQEGVRIENWRERVELLLHKVNAIDPEDRALSMVIQDNAGSIADPPDLYEDDRAAILLRTLVEVLRGSRDAGASLTELLEAIDPVRADVRCRLRAWLLSQFDDAPLDLVVKEIETAISSRDPTGDDVPLVDRVTAGASEGYVAVWHTAMGTPPSPEDVGRALAEGSVDKSWFRRRWWSALLPAAATAAWSKANAVLEGAYGPASRTSILSRPQVEVGHGTSPISVEDLAQMSVEDAGRWVARWRPDANAWLVGARELARTLEAVVKATPDPWTVAPLQMVSILHEPIYVSHYFRGLADAQVPPNHADDIVEAVAFARTHPWLPVPLGRDDFDYDPSWANADNDGITLLRHMADTNVGFGSRSEQVWTMVLEAARSPDEPTTFDDPLTAALNRAQTRAVEAVYGLMAWEYRQTKAVHPEALALLDAALRKAGSDGEQHRAVIAPRLPFLLFVAPDWVDERTDLIFGSEAPDGLAQATVDLFIKWGRPNRWFYEQARGPLLQAVRHNSPRGLNFWLVAMLWGLEGYGVDETVGLLAAMGDSHVSDAGETLGRLLREGDVDANHLTMAVAFFDSVLKLERPNAVRGFGWFAELGGLPEQTWLQLTARAARLAAGRLDWGHKVADRAASSTTHEALEILNELVRGLPDEWDRGHVMEKALGLLRRTGSLRDTEPFRRLRTSLLERGVFAAEDL